MQRLPLQSLGRSDLRVSRLGYGGWRLAGADPATLSPVRREEGRRAVMAAFEAGYTFFDFADIYGDGACESVFGEVLREAGGLRERVVIATKCGIRKKGVPTAAAPYRYDSSREHIVRSCEASLSRMGVDRVDLLMIHRPDYLGDPGEIAGAFDELRRAGKVREFGVSNFRPSQLTALQKACASPLLVNQIELHLLRLEPFQDGTLDQCLAEGITPLAWSPLAGGRLVDANPIDLHSRGHAHRIRLREVLDLLARERGVSRTVMALAWLLKHPSRIVPLVGSTRPDRIAESAQAAHLELTREEWYRLLEAALDERLP